MVECPSWLKDIFSRVEQLVVAVAVGVGFPSKVHPLSLPLMEHVVFAMVGSVAG